jgi:hypothetical protein
MANPTTNFGWQMPTATDLVTDLPADFEVFGQAVDTDFVDLLGGTTGQVLSKASATDLDFAWIAQDDSNAIQNAIMDAKGDLIGATAADTPSRLAVGTDGQILTADSAEATGLKWTTAASGGMTLINSGTVTSGTLDVGSIPGTYNDLQLWIYEFDPGTSGATPAFRFNSDSTSKYPNSVTGAASTNGATYFHGQYDMNDTVATGLVILTIKQYANTGQNKMFLGNVAGAAGDNVANGTMDMFLGMYNATGAITSIQTPFNNQGGTAMSFKWILYGVK